MPHPDIHLLSVGTALPGPLIDNAALVRSLGLPKVWEQWIDTFVGTRSRHFATDLRTKEVRYSLTDMGVTAASRALEAAGVGADSVDLIVMGTATPDMLMPATVNLVADRLGINNVPSYQLMSGCTGAIQAMDVACRMLESGRYTTALVIGGETCAKLMDLDQDISQQPPGVQVNAMLFGDGAGAVVLTTEPRPGTPVLRQVSLELVGQGREPGQVVEWFSALGGAPGQKSVVEDFKAVEEAAPPMAAEALQSILDDLGWKEDELDFVLPPQLSAVMTAKVLADINAPEAVPISRVTEIGNTGNALPFFQLETLLPQMQEGDRAVGVSVEASKWIKAAYAVEMVGADQDGR
ncbi:3-oxoacyl-ACP synthase III family protein [Nocardiopsis deserti]|uniref:3-oxoacyl-ACP synthase III family protein n=1 Tax=Nocardiopsis deserti TaxID=2605988 RepID=UPI00123BAC18|nr:3-oxoacyl-ACP synthase III family protein [Nocardiopsis deserti]